MTIAQGEEMVTGFRQKLSRLAYFDFQAHDRHREIVPGLSDEELRVELEKAPSNELYLGRYTVDEIKERLARSGIMDKLAKEGFENLEVEIHTDQVYNHRLYVYEGKRDYDHTLIELRLREGIFEPRQQFLESFRLGPLSMILVEWLMLQNPKKEFDHERPALPEQRYPGLGVLQDLIPLVMEVVRKTGRAGVLDVPEHYHGALFYSRWFRFFNPAMEGKFLAMQRDLVSFPLHLATRCIDKGCLINVETGEAEKWVPGEQILPLSNSFKEYFNHTEYMELRDKAFLENRYDLDLDACKERMEDDEKESRGNEGAT